LTDLSQQLFEVQSVLVKKKKFNIAINLLTFVIQNQNNIEPK